MPGDDPGATLDRFAVFKTLRDATPERERLRGRVTGGWESLITRRGERSNVGSAQIVERLGERHIAYISIGCVGTDIAKVGIPGKRQIAVDVVPQAQVHRWGTIPGDVRNTVHAGIMLGEKARVLQAVAGQPIVRIGAAEIDRGFGVLPSKLGK